MSNESYHHFCPIAKACEILEPRWTLLVLCELLNGATRFNDIRRGVPSMSPTLLSKRLKEMEKNGLVRRDIHPATGDSSYRTTKLADELAPVIMALGDWAHRNVDADVCLEQLDARLLMWNMRRKVNTAVLPARRRSVIQFIFPELPEQERNYWIIGRPGVEADLCVIDPGHDVDLFITADLKALTSAWMGHSALQTEIDRNKISLVGDDMLANSMGTWMVRSRYAAA
ncbi:MAG: helix-turn-helix transcriptional regulator [Rhizobiales bacterium]|nr:helix-turn-helix transcriptional regulator [Hyphomicrobiales bacterium]